jgi:hypothetical protein
MCAADGASSNGALPPAASSGADAVDPLADDMGALQLTRRDSFEVGTLQRCGVSGACRRMLHCLSDRASQPELQHSADWWARHGVVASVDAHQT